VQQYLHRDLYRKNAESLKTKSSMRSCSCGRANCVMNDGDADKCGAGSSNTKWSKEFDTDLMSDVEECIGLNVESKVVRITNGRQTLMFVLDFVKCTN